jgi:hypothetical protein
MAHAYTPGLRITERTTVRKQRHLPIAGKVLVEKGARVRADDVVAKAELPGDVYTVNVVNLLAIAPEELDRYMLKKEGDAVARDEVIAETRPFIKWFRSVARSPIDGTIETVSRVTGQVMVRGAPQAVDVRAYIDGTVVEVQPNEGVIVETAGAFIQGILGVGGEVYGELAIVGDGPDAVVGPGDLGDDLSGKIVVAGALVSSEVYERAAGIGVAALVCGGFHDSDLRRLLGYDLGVAITGHEDIRPILIMTEGFGRIAIAQGTYEVLVSRAGRCASANGATQIRAGVLRPEIIIPAADAAEQPTGPPGQVAATGLTVGSPVRIIREPGFGRLGAVKELPPGVEAVECETKVRVVVVEFPGGESVTVPRANVEAIES